MLRLSGMRDDNGRGLGLIVPRRLRRNLHLEFIIFRYCHFGRFRGFDDDLGDLGRLTGEGNVELHLAVG